MSLLNFSAPFLATPPPPPSSALLPTFYHHQQQQQHHQPLYNPQQYPYSYPTPQKPFLREDYGSQYHHHQQQQQQQPQPQPSPSRLPNNQAHIPEFTKVEDDGTKTKVHAVIDYDDYDEDDEDSGGGGGIPPVTPIQGPIFIKNGSVPVVPLYSHPVLNNGSFVQIPILWTALSVALGLELRGEYIRGVPCIKRHQQLFCPTAGNSYPLDRIELFIDENKALMKRMYGEFDMGPPSFTQKKKRSTNKPGVPDMHFDPGPETTEFLEKIRNSRQSIRNNNNNQSDSGRVDACESKMEIITPYWASNSAGKIRAIVNTQHFEQAIHQEVCAKARTSHCGNECGCEQKYKWHRLLAYDPDNDCKGIFMDWFLFPSCCVCRCRTT